MSGDVLTWYVWYDDSGILLEAETCRQAETCWQESYPS